MKLSKGISLALLLASTSPTVYAADVTFNGFLSAGIGYADVDSDDVIFAAAADPNDPRLTSYFSYDDTVSFDNDSVFGLQVDAELDENISLTGQFVGRGVEDYETTVEWAFVSYRASDSLTLRAGRLRIPFYMFSDFLEVGYAYPWITPPRESYTLSPFTGYDGIDLIHTTSFGDWYSLIQAYWGNNNDEEFVPTFNGNFQFDITNIFGVAWTVSNDYLSLRFGYHFLHENTATGPTLTPRLNLFEGLETSFRNFAESETGLTAEQIPSTSIYGILFNQFAELNEAIKIEKDSNEVLTFGVEVDWNNVLFISEYINFKPELSAFRETNVFYTTFGYRFGPALLHYTYEQIEQESNVEELRAIITFDDTLRNSTEFNTPSSSLPGGATARLVIDNTLDGLRVLNGNKSISHTVGIRYDISASMAIKTEVLYSDVDFRTPLPPDPISGIEIDAIENANSLLYTIGIDLVF